MCGKYKRKKERRFEGRHEKQNEKSPMRLNHKLQQKKSKCCYVIFNTCSDAINGGSFEWLFEDYEAKAINSTWNNGNIKRKKQAAKLYEFI